APPVAVGSLCGNYKRQGPPTLKLDPSRMTFGGFDRIGKKKDLTPYPMELGKKLKLNLLLKRIYERAKRFFEIPGFRQYAIADGIYRVLFPSKTGIMPNLERKEAEGQLPLPFAVHLS
ncbi:MAG: hypothetical protein ACFFCW_11120, partial [Candidatus Hodarchaeota archaeon]